MLNLMRFDWCLFLLLGLLASCVTPSYLERDRQRYRWPMSFELEQRVCVQAKPDQAAQCLFARVVRSEKNTSILIFEPALLTELMLVEVDHDADTVLKQLRIHEAMPFKVADSAALAMLTEFFPHDSAVEADGVIEVFSGRGESADLKYQWMEWLDGKRCTVPKKLLVTPNNIFGPPVKVTVESIAVSCGEG